MLDSLGSIGYRFKESRIGGVSVRVFCYVFRFGVWDLRVWGLRNLGKHIEFRWCLGFMEMGKHGVRVYIGFRVWGFGV